MRQFLKGIPDAVRGHVGPQRPRTLAQAEDLFRRFTEYNSLPAPSSRPPKVYAAKAEPKAALDVDQLRKDLQADIRSAIKELLPAAARTSETTPPAPPAQPRSFTRPGPDQRTRGGRIPKSEVVCYRCQQKGHFAKECALSRSAGLPTEKSGN